MPAVVEFFTSLSPAYILAGASLFGVVVLGIAVIMLTYRLRRFMKGKSGASLEETLLSIAKRVDDSARFEREMEAYLTGVEGRLRRSIGSTELIRFTPFKGLEGGGQSFATCFLNENGDGLILSSLFVRDRTSVYAKPVKNGTPVFEASEEEKEALARAKAALKEKR